MALRRLPREKLNPASEFGAGLCRRKKGFTRNPCCRGGSGSADSACSGCSAGSAGCSGYSAGSGCSADSGWTFSVPPVGILVAKAQFFRRVFVFGAECSAKILCAECGKIYKIQFMAAFAKKTPNIHLKGFAFFQRVCYNIICIKLCCDK